MKLLIDECLSEALAKRALERGYLESAHVRWIGRGGAKDWELLPIILDGDWTFVTCNAVDFRGAPNAPGEKGEYRKASIHAGLICLNAASMDLHLQLELFEQALDALDENADLVNQVLEVSLDDIGDGEIIIRRYALPE